MPGGTSAVVLKNLHTLFQVGTAGGLTDGQLIERFLNQRDDGGDAAFRALVERHAPMVLRVCHDVVSDWHEAEDAAQATFIVLACKAGSIRKRDSAASWLFGVACRVAAQAKAKLARRRRHEQRRAELAAADNGPGGHPVALARALRRDRSLAGAVTRATRALLPEGPYPIGGGDAALLSSANTSESSRTSSRAIAEPPCAPRFAPGIGIVGGTAGPSR